MKPDLIGWIASAILIATLARQTWRQWKDPDPRGVSHWLFVGQIAASIGFVAYSWMMRNWVFITTNTLILVTAIVGQWVFLRAQRKADISAAGHASSQAGKPPGTPPGFQGPR